jgi:hypothetical protein
MIVYQVVKHWAAMNAWTGDGDGIGHTLVSMVPCDKLLPYLHEQDAIREELTAFVEGLLPAEAEHSDPTTDTRGYIECSENEGGHVEGDCPQDLGDDDKIYGVPVGEIRALVAKARGTAVTP